VIIYLFRWRLNLLALKESSAFSLGVSVNFERFSLLGLAVLISAAVTSVAGLVGWVGLIIPHLARRMFGADANFSVPGSIILGGIIVLACDDFCRTVFPGEIPLGIATSLVGAVAFLLIMATGSRITKE
jgi:iron complex transport system permease protein